MIVEGFQTYTYRLTWTFETSKPEGFFTRFFDTTLCKMFYDKQSAENFLKDQIELRGHRLKDSKIEPLTENWV